VAIISAPHPIRVGIIEDLPEVREGLMALIDGAAGFECSCGYRSMEEALARLSPGAVDVILTDLGLPGMSGAEGIRILRERAPDVPILALTIYDDRDDVFNALCAGASGYLLKNTPPERLLESVREVASGGAPMSPEVARKVIKLFREIRPPKHADYQLTPHQIRLLKLLADGHNYKTAAVELGVTVDTIAFHLRHIYEKLQVHSKSEAVAKALRDRIIS
jgi:DNA-binding NarL/FixJ family response regulator